MEIHAQSKVNLKDKELIQEGNYYVCVKMLWNV